MGWSAFTSYLSPGDVLRRDQFEELIEAITERAEIAAACSGGTFAFDASPGDVVSRGLPFTFLGDSYGAGAGLHELLALISEGYAKTDTGLEAWSVSLSDTVILDVLADEGLTSGEWTAILASDVLSHHYFNVLRRAVLALARPLVAGDDSTEDGVDEISNAYGTWADAAAHVTDNTGGPVLTALTCAGYNAAGNYTAVRRNTSCDLLIPGLSAFSSGYSLKFFGVLNQYLGGSASAVADDVRLTVGATVSTFAFSPGVFSHEVSGLTATGAAVAFVADLAGFDDLTPYDPGAPTSGTENTGSLDYGPPGLAAGLTFRAFALPTFDYS